MLKNAREYLQKRLDKVNEELKTRRLLQMEYNNLKTRYQEGQEYIKAYKNQDKAKTILVGDCIFYFLITVILTIVIALCIPPFTIPFFIGMSLLAGVDIFRISSSIIKYKKAKKKFKETKSAISLFEEEELANVDEFERDLYRQTEQKMSLNDLAVNRLTREINALWDILSSDNFVESLIRQDKNTDEVARALYKEWEEYLKELNSQNLTDYNTLSPINHTLEPSIQEDDYKHSTKNFALKKKRLENKPHHPLSTY